MSKADVDALAMRMLANLAISVRKKVTVIILRSTAGDATLASLSEDAFGARVDAALDVLAAHPEVRSFGDIHNWRHAELCRILPPDCLDADLARQNRQATDDLNAPLSG